MKTFLLKLKWLFFLLSTSHLASSQVNNPALTSSDEAQNLQKHSETAVNNSTGVPQISFPLGTLQSQNGAMSFSLVYDASGRRVDELASSCGWGWSLIGGGQINRVVKGEQDEYESCIGHVYQNHGELGIWELIHWMWKSTAEPNTGGPYVRDFVSPTSDITVDPDEDNYSEEQIAFQPDEYHFSFNGRSVMFVINSEGIPVCIPLQNLKITYQECLQWFEIEDENGWKYRFSIKEITEFGSMTGFGLKRTQQAATTWYLSSVKNNKNQVEFSLSYSSGGDDLEISTSIMGVSYEGENDCPDAITQTNYSYNKHNRQILLLVFAPLTGNIIEFNYNSTREDIPSLKSLDEVVITNSNDVEVSKIELNYNYFLNELGGAERLKLESVEAVSSQESTKSIVSFSYDETIPINSNENTVGKDHWGYYNGLDFNSIENLHVNGGGRRVDPSQNQRGILKNIVTSGGQRTSFEYETNTYSESPNGLVSPSSVQTSVTISGSLVINSEDYYNYEEPIFGGSFQFASNDLSFNFVPVNGINDNVFEDLDNHCGLGYTFYKPSALGVLNPEANADGIFDLLDMDDVDHPQNDDNYDIYAEERIIVPSPRTKVNSKSFTIDNEQTIEIAGVIAPTLCGAEKAYIRILRTSINPWQEVWIKQGLTDAALSVHESVDLSPGNYRIEYVVVYPYFDGIPAGYVPRAELSNTLVTQFSFDFSPLVIEQPSPNSKYCGGPRIRSLTYDDINDSTLEPITTNYYYNLFSNEQESSGFLYSEPISKAFFPNFYKQQRKTGVWCSGGVSTCHECDRIVISSNGMQPLLTANGSFVVYRNVRVQEGNGTRGWMENEFSVEVPELVDLKFSTQVPFKSWRSGLLIKSRIFNSNGQKISETINSFDQLLSNPAEVKGLFVADIAQLGISKNRANCELNLADCENYLTYGHLNYKYLSEYVTLTDSYTESYDLSNPSKFITQNVSYSFDIDNPSLVRKIVSISDDPRVPITVKKFKYVGDYLPSATGGPMNNALYRLNNIVQYGKSTPIETIELAGTTESDLKVYSGTITELKLDAQNHLLVAANYDLVLEQPIPEGQFDWSTITGDNFTFNPNYRKREDEIRYDSDDRVVCIKPKDNIPNTKIYNEKSVLLAEVVNAYPEQCSYDSFEQDEQTTWNFSPSNILDQPQNILGLQLKSSKTGHRSLNLAQNISKSLAPGKYTISLWATSPSFTLTSNDISQNRIINQEGQDLQGWAYYEYLIDVSSNTLIQINGNSSILIDELRVYPWDAQMNSVSYNLDGTMRNECDVNNFVSTILYDEWKRPEWKLDDRLQILSKITYHDRDLSDPSDRSWMSEAVVLEQGMTASQILSASPSDARLRLTKKYFDGFGRNIQTHAVRQSGNSVRDLVSFHVFDGIGREARVYLPFASQSNNNGNHIVNPVGAQSQFYQSALYVAHTDYPFSETIFENSPLNRVLEQGNVGETWQIGNGHTTRIGYHFNESNEVLKWVLTETGSSAVNSGVLVYYPENSLQKKHVIDESGASFWEFTDVYGKLICKRTFALMNGPLSTPSFFHTGSGRISDNSTLGFPGSGPSLRRLDVYYVYDDFGNLIYEIPAIASLAMGANQQFSSLTGGVNYTIFDGYMTSSRYDKFGNVITKKKPGEGWSFYVYNKLGQVVLSKSPSQSELGNQWNFVKYDKLGRPIQTGIYSSTSSREQLQTLAYYGAIISEDKTGNVSNVYTNQSFPNNNLEILTETFYDNHDFDINGFTYSHATPVPVAQSKRTKGITTGSRVKVLDGTNNFLVSVSYYDVFGRSAVQFSENILGGFDKITNLYDYTGALTESRRYFKRNDGASEGIHIVNKFEYDHAGRPTITKQRINNDQEIILSRLIYNALGQVVKKHLHIAGAANTGMQVVDYRYNERGWLKKINNADLSNDGDNLESWDVFGQEIIYNDIENYYSNTMQAIAQFGGNISAVKWKTNVTGEDPNQMGGHSYVFRYDDLGQMTGAYYAASNDDFIDNYNSRMNHWDERVSYDSNGNILSMYRTRGKNAEGVVLPSNALNPINMDILTYNYFEHSNKLKSISDAASTGWISNSFSNPFSHFVDGNTSATDYFYDQEGRLTKDENKGLEFSYNHLDLVEKAKYGTEEVKFIWDASGVKLAKQIGATITYYFEGIEYTNNTVTHIATSEGIARPASGTANSSEWHYDYYLKDHLGNVRAIITEENSELESERVTVELARRMLEDSSFDNVSATEKDKPFMYPYDPADPNNQKVSELSKLTGKIIGPAKVIAVRRGEKVDLSTKYWYTEEPGTPLTDLTEILAGTLFNLGMASAGIIPNGPEAGMALLNNVSGDQFGNLSNFLSNSFNDVDLQKPRAYIVYMSFDKNMMLDPRNSGKIQVTDANTLAQLSKQDVIFRTDGYFYVYVTNQSETHVNFDNLIIRRWKPQVRVTYDYYPFGLTWENPKLPGTEEGLHDHTYQDKEYQFAEFSDGRGLELHDFHARMYDATTGRWLVPDPAAQFANPYLAMGNNPVIGVDPDGRFSVITTWLTGFVHGFFSTGSGRWNEGWQNANHSAGNNLKIKRGLFVTDKNKTFGGRVWELVSRFTWQLPQTIGGYYTAQTYNIFQKVNWVEHEHGATVVNADRMLRSQDENWGAVAQGSFIVGDPSIEANAHNSLFQHEYGHYLQSQEMGWGYYNRVGIPSIRSEGTHIKHPVEQDANRRAFMYFNEEVDGFYVSEEAFSDRDRNYGWDFQKNPLGLRLAGVGWGDYWDYNNKNRMDLLNRETDVRAKWYDYFFGYPFIGLLNSHFYNQNP